MNDSLIESARKGDLSGVKNTLLKGANVNAVSLNGWVALHFASVSGHTDVVEILLNHNADINVVTKDGLTPVMLAAEKGHKDVILILTKRGANLDFVDANGCVALHNASIFGHTDVIEILLNHNANINVVTKNGDTPVMLAAKMGCKDVILILAQRGANLNLVNADGWAALHEASNEGYADIVEILLNHNADINVVTKDRLTPVMLAAKKGHQDVILILAQRGANLDLVDADCNSALHIACQEGHIDVIRFLLSQGADITIKNTEGNTPLDEYHGKSKDEIVRLFSKYNPKRVLEDVSIWNIEYLNEEQVFEKPDYGVKFVIPPSSVEVGKKVTTEVKVVALEKSEIILPPDVQPVSCFYNIKTTGKFSRPIELHLQHNVELRSQEDSQQLAFIKAKGPPPYKFELVSASIDQEFKPYDNSGVVKTTDFGVFGAVKKENERPDFCPQPSCSYAMTLFFKHNSNFNWAIQAVITKNLGPFLKRVNTEKFFDNWNRLQQFSFYFDPKVNKLTCLLDNDYYDIKPLRMPCQVTKEDVDKSQPDNALLHFYFEVTLKVEQKELTDLELTFKGMRDENRLIITSYQLQSVEGNADKIIESSTPYFSEHIDSLSQKEIPEELLCKEPKKKHLMELLHPIRHIWEIIGQQLEVQHDDIMSIKLAQCNVSYANTMNLSEVLQVWIDRKTCEVSWRMIITVTDKPPVEEKRVADEIRKFLARPDIMNEYLPSDPHGQVITTYNSLPPISPKPTEIKDEMEQEAPLQSSNPIGFAAHHLYKHAEQWEEKDNDMIVATKHMVRLMMHMSKFAQGEDSDVNSKDDFIQTVSLIVKDSNEVVRIAKQVAEHCTDTQLKNTLSKVLEGIPNTAIQLKINVGAHAKQEGNDPETNKEFIILVTDNAQNLMAAVSEVLNATESAFIKVPQQDRVHVTHLNWVKK